MTLVGDRIYFNTLTIFSNLQGKMVEFFVVDFILFKGQVTSLALLQEIDWSLVIYSNGYVGGWLYKQWDARPYPRGITSGDHDPAPAHYAPHLVRIVFQTLKGLIDKLTKLNSKLRDNLSIELDILTLVIK